MSVFAKLRRSKHSHGLKLMSKSLTAEEDKTDSLCLMSNTAKLLYTPGIQEILEMKCEAMREVPYSNPPIHQNGQIAVTNYKISFLQAESMDSTLVNASPLVNKLANNNDIVIYNIDAIYKVSKSKRKKLNSSIGVSRRIYRLEIHCKDFRIHWFVFSPIPEVQLAALKLVNKIRLSVFGVAVQSTRFAKHLPNVSAKTDVSNRVVRFNSQADWLGVLQRRNALKKFKLDQYNTNYQLSECLPEFFPVPASMSFADVLQLAQKFIDGLCPIWSYTHANDELLVRMGQPLPDLDKEVRPMVLQLIRECGSSGNEPVILDLTNLLPPLAEIRSSFASLRKLCMPNCRWLSIVGQCLTVANKVSEDIDDNRLTVILQERTVSDMVPLIACLVQLLLDEHCRSMSGFEELIDREWVALGHQFYDRYATASAEKCPVFLLFLDCVTQLRYQFPAEFEFSEIYLVRVWDSLCCGAFRTFSFNSIRDSLYAQTGASSSRRGSDGLSQPHAPPFAFFPSAWEWSVQFADAQIALNYDPVYVMRREANAAADDRSLRATNGNGHLSNSKTTKLIRLRPRVCIRHLRLWSLCYLRWVTPVMIAGGGMASEYLTQCLLAEEIQSLRAKICTLQASCTGTVVQRPRSMLVFGGRNAPAQLFDESDLSIVDWYSTFNESLPTISSSFPFMACDRDSVAAAAGMSIDSYYEASVLFGDSDAASCATGIDSMMEASFISTSNGPLPGDVDHASLGGDNGNV